MEGNKKTKLQRRLEYLKSHPEEMWRVDKPIIPQACDEDNPNCKYCKSECYKCAVICSVSGLSTRRKNTRFLTQGYRLRYTLHAFERMLQRGITHSDVEEMFANNMVSNYIHAEYVVDELKKEITLITVWATSWAAV